MAEGEPPRQPRNMQVSKRKKKKKKKNNLAIADFLP